MKQFEMALAIKNTRKDKRHNVSLFDYDYIRFLSCTY